MLTSIPPLSIQKSPIQPSTSYFKWNTTTTVTLVAIGAIALVGMAYLFNQQASLFMQSFWNKAYVTISTQFAAHPNYFYVGIGTVITGGVGLLIYNRVFHKKPVSNSDIKKNDNSDIKKNDSAPQKFKENSNPAQSPSRIAQPEENPLKDKIEGKKPETTDELDSKTDEDRPQSPSTSHSSPSRADQIVEDPNVEGNPFSLSEREQEESDPLPQPNYISNESEDAIGNRTHEPPPDDEIRAEAPFQEHPGRTGSLIPIGTGTLTEFAFSFFSGMIS